MLRLCILPFGIYVLDCFYDNHAIKVRRKTVSLSKITWDSRGHCYGVVWCVLSSCGALCVVLCVVLLRCLVVFVGLAYVQLTLKQSVVQQGHSDLHGLGSQRRLYHFGLSFLQRALLFLPLQFPLSALTLFFSSSFLELLFRLSVLLRAAVLSYPGLAVSFVLTV